MTFSSSTSVQYSIGSGVPGSTFGPPPCNFNALILATRTTQFGIKLEYRHLMLKNFSIPISAPNPASVTFDCFKWLLNSIVS
jgi:hypothetical protein